MAISFSFQGISLADFLARWDELAAGKEANVEESDESEIEIFDYEAS
jgi:hypothetical protein